MKTLRRSQLLACAAVLTASVFGASSAMATDTIDVTAVVTSIGGAVGPIGEIGSAVLLVIVAIAAYKWVRRSI